MLISPKSRRYHFQYFEITKVFYLLMILQILTFISFISSSWQTNSKDFNPGFIKRPRYCCGKCELRMLEHESLNMDSECPFQAYQRQTKSSLCYTSDVMSQDLYCGPDIDPYVYYESPWDTQKEDYTLSKRSKSVPATIRPPHFIPNQWSRHLTQNQMFPKHGSFGT